MNASFLSSVPLFSSLSPGDLAEFTGSVRLVVLEKGEILFRENEVGNRFYIVVSGEVEAIKALGTPEERLLNVVGRGGYVGEMSLLVSDNLRTASVRARSESHLMELRRERFEELIEQRPSIAYHMVRELSERLRVNDETTIRDLREKNRELAAAYEELKAAQQELVEKEKLEHELDMARSIQMSILPQDVLVPQGCAVGAKMVPARAVGGDFYDIIPLGEHQVGVAIGDVSDKGVAAAMFMAQFCTLLRVEALKTRDPKTVLTNVNNYLLEANLAGLFVTAIYGIYDCQTHQFHYARAGHEVPVIFDQEGDVSQPPHAQGTALCVFPDPPIDVQTVIVPPGSTLLMYTDGGTDAMNLEQNFFGLDELKKTISAHLGASPQSLCELVIARLLSFQEDFQFDDATLVALRAQEGASD